MKLQSLGLDDQEKPKRGFWVWIKQLGRKQEPAVTPAPQSTETYKWKSLTFTEKDFQDGLEAFRLHRESRLAQDPAIEEQTDAVEYDRLPEQRARALPSTRYTQLHDQEFYEQLPIVAGPLNLVSRKVVTTAKAHACTSAWRDHEIPARTKAVCEISRINGKLVAAYQCLECLDLLNPCFDDERVK